MHSAFPNQLVNTTNYKIPMASGIFSIESSDDSIPTDYTAESEGAETYEVERILCEERNIGDGEMRWLVKWAG